MIHRLWVLVLVHNQVWWIDWVSVFAHSWALCTESFCFVLWNNDGPFIDIVADAAPGLCQCGLHNKFIHEYFKLKAYPHLTHPSFLPLYTIQAFFTKQGCPCACNEGIWGSGGLAPHSPNIDTRWRSVVIFMCWLLYLQGITLSPPLLVS
jgi:hypothetical protein